MDSNPLSGIFIGLATLEYVFQTSIGWVAEKIIRFRPISSRINQEKRIAILRKIYDLVPREEIYKTLLTHNPLIPCKGFNFEGGAKKLNGQLQFPINKTGSFVILSKDVPKTDPSEKKRANQIVIKCAWVSGEHIGTIFEVTNNRFTTFDSTLDLTKVMPYIFRPWKWLTLGFEVTIAFASIIAILRAALRL